ncbi:MAG: hypothetical protein AAGA02_00215 [Bacteroidota bacterium]
MNPLIDQIEFLQSECKRNRIAFDLIRFEFGERNAKLVARPLLNQASYYESIITSLEELKRIKKER